MRIITWSVILAVFCVASSGCNKSQQTTPTAKTALESKTSGEMKYNIIERDAFTVMGLSNRVTTTDANSEKFDKIWQDFEPFRAQIRPLSTDWRYCGVRFTTKEKGVIDYVAGMAVRDDAAAPDPNLVTRKVSAARCAVFQCSSRDVEQTYQQIFNQWLPGSRYVLNKDAYTYELYLPRGRENRLALIHIPVINKGKQ